MVGKQTRRRAHHDDRAHHHGAGATPGKSTQVRTQGIARALAAHAADADKDADKDADHDKDDDKDGVEAHAAKKKSKAGLALMGQRLLSEVQHVLEGIADKLSEYSPHTANHSKQILEEMAESCGPSTVAIQRRIQVHAGRMTSFYFARLASQLGKQARNMAKACHDLREGLHDGDPTALGVFIRDAIEAAFGVAGDLGEFSKDTREVDDLVHRIGVRCGEKPKLEIPKAIEPLVTPKPRLELHIHPDLQIHIPGIGAGPVILPGLKLPGQHRVVPKAIIVPKGPIQLEA
jgi:hypothetical protein